MQEMYLTKPLAVFNFSLLKAF